MLIFLLNLLVTWGVLPAVIGPLIPTIVADIPIAEAALTAIYEIFKLIETNQTPTADHVTALHTALKSITDKYTPENPYDPHFNDPAWNGNAIA